MMWSSAGLDAAVILIVGKLNPYIVFVAVNLQILALPKRTRAGLTMFPIFLRCFIFPRDGSSLLLEKTGFFFLVLNLHTLNNLLHFLAKYGHQIFQFQELCFHMICQVDKCLSLNISYLDSSTSNHRSMWTTRPQKSSTIFRQKIFKSKAEERDESRKKIMEGW